MVSSLPYSFYPEGVAVNQLSTNVTDDARFVLRLTAIAGFVLVLTALVSTVAPLAMAHPGTGDSAQKVAAYMIEQARIVACEHVFAGAWLVRCIARFRGWPVQDSPPIRRWIGHVVLGGSWRWDCSLCNVGHPGRDYCHSRNSTGDR